jgi:uroporphyrinogen-III synthase
LAPAELGQLKIAAIGPATRNALEAHGMHVDVMPREYVAEAVVARLRRRVKGKRVLLVRAQVARDVIPRELRQAGARVDVREAYVTVTPQASRARLLAALKRKTSRPDVITFTSSSTAKSFVDLIGPEIAYSGILDATDLASIGPVTTQTLRELHLPVAIHAKEYTIPGLVDAIIKHFQRGR